MAKKGSPELVPALTVSRNEAATKLLEQKQRAEKIRDQQIGNLPELELARSDRSQWRDYVALMLRRMFTTDEFSIRFGYLRSEVIDRDSTLIQDIQQFRSKMQQYVNELQSLIQRLDLLDEPDRHDTHDMTAANEFATPSMSEPKAPELKIDRPGVMQRPLRAGREVDAYQLIARLGRGYSAEVWRARLTRPVDGVDLQPGTEVAVKFYLSSMLQGMQTVRIQREFSIATEVTHKNLARVFDLVLSPSRPFHTFMAMEYVPGSTLKSRIEKNGKLSAADTIEIAEQLFSALEELHGLGAIHRDVKAANIMLTDYAPGKPTIKLVDLGIVWMKQEDGFTDASLFLGSKHSAPLEQLSGEDIDERADIYGAGSVLYHCLTGAPMYSGVGPEGAIVRRMLTTPERFDDAATDPLKAFVNRCISRDVRDRPETAAECLKEIRRVGMKSETGKIPTILVGRWDHQWGPELSKSAAVTITGDGLYTAFDGAVPRQFRLQNAIHSKENREVRFDLIAVADGNNDSTQILHVETPDLLDGVVEGQPKNLRRYTRI